MENEKGINRLGMAAANGRADSDAAYCALVNAAVQVGVSILDGTKESQELQAAARKFLIGEFGGEK